MKTIMVPNDYDGILKLVQDALTILKNFMEKNYT